MFFSANHFHHYTKNLSGTCFTLVLQKTESFFFLLYSVYGGKFEVKEKKNNPKLAINMTQEIKKETMHQECFILILSL